MVLTGVYAFTDYRLVVFVMKRVEEFRDYRSQGQTVFYVLVDIATPPTGGLSLFNLYVALSRSSGRESSLLRDFDDVLLAKDDRLDALNEQTLRWWKEMKSRRSSGEQVDKQVVD